MHTAARTKTQCVQDRGAILKAVRLLVATKFPALVLVDTKGNKAVLHEAENLNPFEPNPDAVDRLLCCELCV